MVLLIVVVCNGYSKSFISLLEKKSPHVKGYAILNSKFSK